MTGPRVVIEILGDNDGALEAMEQAKAKIKEITATVEAMGRGMNAHSKMAVNAFRAEAQEAERALTLLRATKDEHAKLQRVVAGVESNVTAASHKFAMATRQMAYGFEAVARTGKLAGEAGRQLISTGAEMALMFGGAGPIVGAVGVAGLAIYSLFSRSRREMEETRAKAEEELKKLLKSTNLLSVQESVTEAFSTVREIEAKLAAARVRAGTPSDAREVGAAGAPAGILGQAVQSPTLALEKELEAAKAAHAVRKQHLDELAAKETERTLIGAREEARQQRITEELRKQLEITRENAQIRERLNKELFGTDAIGRANEGAPPSRLADTLKIAGPLKGVDIPAFPIPDIAPIQLYAGAVGSIADQMIKLPSVAETAFAAMAGAASAAFDALVIGGDASIKNLKKLFGEPIVAHLRAKAVEEFVLGSTELVRLNLPKAGGHFRNAALATAGAALVGRIAGVGAPGGGLGGGSGGGGGGAGSGGFSGIGPQLGAAQREAQLVKLEILIVQQTPDGRTIARHTQQVQRQRDLDQPLRVTL